MNEILSNYLDIFCIAYLDNILVFSQNEEKQWEHQSHTHTSTRHQINAESVQM